MSSVSHFPGRRQPARNCWIVRRFNRVSRPVLFDFGRYNGEAVQTEVRWASLKPDSTRQILPYMCAVNAFGYMMGGHEAQITLSH